MNLAGGQLRRADNCLAAFDREGKALAIHVVAVGDLITHVHFTRLFGRTELEGDGGIEEVVRGVRGVYRQRQKGERRGHHQPTQNETRKIKHEEDAAFLH